MEMDSVANLGTLQTPLVTFFPSKKRPNLVSENHILPRQREVLLSQRARTHLSLSLSLRLLCSAPAHLSLSLFLSLSLSASAQRAAERGAAL